MKYEEFISLLSLVCLIVWTINHIYKQRKRAKELLKCPLCSNELKPTKDNHLYFMCYTCIKGYTTEELKGARNNEA